MGVVPQARDRRLLSALRTLRAVDRTQAGALLGIGSVRRANARLLALTRAGYLRRSFLGAEGFGRRALYRLPGTRAPKSAGHQLLINRVYLRLHADGSLLRWETPTRPVADGIPLVPDAYAEVSQGGQAHALFFEVDRGTESGRVWQGKAHNYLSFALSGEFPRRFGHARFRVAVLTTTPRRVANIRRAVAPVTDRLFWFSTFDILNGEPLSAACWLRPTGAGKVPLCEATYAIL